MAQAEGHSPYARPGMKEPAADAHNPYARPVAGIPAKSSPAQPEPQTETSEEKPAARSRRQRS